MRRRPVCLLCLVMVLIYGALLALGISPDGGSPGAEAASEIVRETGEYRVFGYVEEFETRENYSICVLTDAFLFYQSKLYSIGKIRITTGEGSRRRVGTLLEACGELAEIAPPENPGQFDQSLYYRVRGIRWEMKNPVVTVLRLPGARRGAAAAGATERPQAAAEMAGSPRAAMDAEAAGGNLQAAAEMAGSPRAAMDAEAAGSPQAAADAALLDALPPRPALRAACDAISENLQLLRAALNRRIAAYFPQETAGVLCSMITGDRFALTDDSRALWRIGGIAHMLAISGLHLSLLGAGIFEILRRARLGVRVSGVISIVLMLFYTVFTGMSVSTVRAFAMFLLMIGARLLGRTYDAPTGLSAAAIFILLENPRYLLYSGFQLSFAAVLICLLFADRGRLTVAAMLYLGTLPLVLHQFFEAPLYGILVNLIAVPLLPFILGMGIFGTTLGGLAVYPASLLVRGLSMLLEWTANLPGAALILGKPDAGRIVLYYAALLGWAALVKRNRLRARRFLFYLLTPLLVVLLAFRPRRGEMAVTFLAVGQGDGIVIAFPTGENALVDGGSSSVLNVGRQRVEPFIKSEGIARLDYVFATHMDDDHVNGIRELLSDIGRRRTAVRVGTLVLPYLKEKDAAYMEMVRLAEEIGVRVLQVSAGDEFVIGHAKLAVLGPDPGREGTPPDANAQCIVLALQYGAFDALLTGDVSGTGEENLLEQLRGDGTFSGAAFEVLKVAHHGSRNSTPEELLALVRAQVSVISCGKKNRYGHPHDELVERLEASGTNIFRTDRDGAVTVRTDGRRFWVETMRAKRQRFGAS